MPAALRCAHYGDLLARYVLLLCTAGRTLVESAACLFCSRSRVYRTEQAYPMGPLGLTFDEAGQRKSKQWPPRNKQRLRHECTNLMWTVYGPALEGKKVVNC
jgi:hypothetical protein